MSVCHFGADPVVPETEPAAVRFLPPTPPPAPPGTAGAGEEKDPRSTAYSLLDLLNRLDDPVMCIRELLMLLETVPMDDPAAPGIRETVRAAQGSCAQVVRTIVNSIPVRAETLLATDLAMAKRDLLRMAARGVERRVLDTFLRSHTPRSAPVFQDVSRTEALAENRLPDEMYQFPLPENLTGTQLGFLFPDEVMRRVLSDLEEALERPAYLVSLQSFDLNVTQRLAALEYVSARCTPSPAGFPESSPRREPRGAADLDPEERLLRAWRRADSTA